MNGPLIALIVISPGSRQVAAHVVSEAGLLLLGNCDIGVEVQVHRARTGRTEGDLDNLDNR